MYAHIIYVYALHVSWIFNLLFCYELSSHSKHIRVNVKKITFITQSTRKNDIAWLQNCVPSERLFAKWYYASWTPAIIRQPCVLCAYSTCWKFRKLESADELHELWSKYAGCRRLRGYPRIKHERRVGDSRESAVLGCIYASDKSADCIFFIILVEALVFSPAPFPPLRSSLNYCSGLRAVAIYPR